MVVDFQWTNSEWRTNLPWDVFNHCNSIVPKKIQLQSSLRTSVALFTPPKQWFVCVRLPQKNPVNPPNMATQKSNSCDESRHFLATKTTSTIETPDPDPFMTLRFSGLKNRWHFLAPPPKNADFNLNIMGHQKTDQPPADPGLMLALLTCFGPVSGEVLDMVHVKFLKPRKRKGVQDGSPCSPPVRVKNAIYIAL